jgi:hypothetical protein
LLLNRKRLICSVQAQDFSSLTSSAYRFKTV